MERKLTAAVITCSDSGYAGERQDVSGPEVVKILQADEVEITVTFLVPDEREQISALLRELADRGKVDLIVTTGGTGFARRDCTPEATRAVITRETPGIPEAMRMYSMQFTGRAMLSRAVAGIRGETLIINLPGSPKAVQETLTYILPHVRHGIEILQGSAVNCARK